MDFAHISWIGVLLGSVAGFGLGALWYGPFFGKVWMELLGFKKEDGKDLNMARLMGTSFATYLVLGIIIALLVQANNAANSGAGGWLSGACIGSMAGVICITTIVNNGMYEMRPAKLLVINGVYSLLNGAVIGAIIGAF